VTETSIFRPDGDVLVATPAARGPWSPGAAHGGATAALLGGLVEELGAADGMRPASLHYTFLGEVPIGPLRVELTREKPGRRQQVVSAALVAGDRTVMRLRAVLLRRGEVALPEGAGGRSAAMPPPDAATPIGAKFLPDDAIAFAPTAIEIRALPAAPDGTVDAWFRLKLPVLPGTEPTPVQRAAAAADFGNGVTEPLPFADFLFVNCDLYVALQRDPVGEWVGLRAKSEIDAVGAGVTTSELHDERGRIGSAIQTLYVSNR
jgi:hypothetical protein